MWHNFLNKDSLERSVLNCCQSRTFTEVAVWFIKLQVWKLIIKKKGQKCRKAYYVLLQTLDGLFLEVDKVAVFFLSVIKLQMGKFLIKKKRPRGLLYKRPTSKSTKKKGLDYIPVATGRTSMAENLITGEWQNLWPWLPTAALPTVEVWNFSKYLSSCFCSNIMQSSRRTTCKSIVLKRFVSPNFKVRGPS